MTQEEARNLVREYAGQDLEKIGTYLPDESSYNHNSYRLPNGTVVVMHNDDDGFNLISVVTGDGQEVYVGAQYDDGEFMIGVFT